MNDKRQQHHTTSQHNTTPNTTSNTTVKHNTEHNTEQNTTQHNGNTTQHNTQHNITQHNTQHNTTPGGSLTTGLPFPLPPALEETATATLHRPFSLSFPPGFRQRVCGEPSKRCPLTATKLLGCDPARAWEGESLYWSPLPFPQPRGILGQITSTPHNST